MASLGNPNSSYDNNKKDYYPVVYPAYSFRNPNGEVDKTALTFTYWNQTLKVTISPRSDSGNGTTPSYDYENGLSVFLDHNKALILLREIEMFQSTGNCSNAGVPSGKSLISISNGKEFGAEENTPCLVIRTIDNETTKEIASCAYQFKKGHHYSIRNYDGDTGECERITEDFDDMELEQFKTLLKQFVTAMTSATAYSVINESRFSDTRMNNKLNQIMDKLGIERVSSNGRSSGGGAFDKVPPNKSTTYKKGMDVLD